MDGALAADRAAEHDEQRAPITVNKGELARILTCSLPTIEALINRYPDMPILQRGSNGVEWQFDAAVREMKEVFDQAPAGEGL
ncbi:MAG TPA: hypothetical protein VFC38_05690 [Stellaceae bacterium]|nr:hypothetical protein [Stellaceae bacterium]